MSTRDDTKTTASSPTAPSSFEEFWPEYVRAHASPLNRRLHFVGTSIAMACAGGALLLRRPSLLLAAPLAGYGFAWVGHFFVEHNKPATFKHPLWSLRGDVVMWKKILDGTMDAEVARVMAEVSGPADTRAEAPADVPAPDTVALN